MFKFQHRNKKNREIEKRKRFDKQIEILGEVRLRIYLSEFKIYSTPILFISKDFYKILSYVDEVIGNSNIRKFIYEQFYISKSYNDNIEQLSAREYFYNDNIILVLEYYSTFYSPTISNRIGIYYNDENLKEKINKLIKDLCLNSNIEN